MARSVLSEDNQPEELEAEADTEPEAVRKVVAHDARMKQPKDQLVASDAEHSHRDEYVRFGIPEAHEFPFHILSAQRGTSRWRSGTARIVPQFAIIAGLAVTLMWKPNARG